MTHMIMDWDITITMTKKQLIDKLQPFFYDDKIHIHKYKDGSLGVFINGFYCNKQEINKRTGINLDMIKIREVDNLRLWKEFGNETYDM